MNEVTRGFGSDNHAPAHPEILKKISSVSMDHAPSYGTDDITSLAIEEFKKHFGPDTEVFFVFNGTSANILSLKTLCKSYQSVFCSDMAHINVDEAAGPEIHGSVKLIPLPSIHGKLQLSTLKENLIRRGDQHFAQPKVISLTQPTEVGTCYSLDEIRQICDWAHANQMLVHVDGSRLSNAVVSLNTDFKTMIRSTGVDMVSFGGTKNGLLFGEAVLAFDSKYAEDLKFYRKQLGQLPSKTRYLTAQFLAYFENDLWKKIAQQSLQAAQQLKEALQGIAQVQITQAVQSNAVFAIIPKAWVKVLKAECFFYVWDERTTECRWMTSWDTSPNEIQKLTNKLKELSK